MQALDKQLNNMVYIKRVNKKSDILEKIEKSFTRYWERHIVKKTSYRHPNDLIYKPRIKDDTFKTVEVTIDGSVHKKIDELTKELYNQHMPLSNTGNYLRALLEGISRSPGISIKRPDGWLESLSIGDIEKPGYKLLGLLGQNNNVRSVDERGYDSYSSEEIPRGSPYLFLNTEGKTQGNLKLDITRIGNRPFKVIFLRFDKRNDSLIL